MLFIFDFRLGQRGFFNHRPHDGLGAAIQATVHHEFLKFGNNYRFGVKRHGGIGVLPIAQNAQPLKLPTLNGHPFFGETAAFGAKFAGRHIIFVQTLIAVLLLDFPFNRQAVAIPAGHISGVFAHHLLRAHNHVFQDFVQRMADMHIAIGVRRAVMQHEFFAALPLRAQFVIKANARPICENFGLAFGQTGLHWKVRLRQIKRFAIIT